MQLNNKRESAAQSTTKTKNKILANEDSTHLRREVFAQVRRHRERNVAHVAAELFDALVHHPDVRAHVRTLRERLVALFATKRLQFVVHAADVRVERLLKLGAVFAMRALEVAHSAATNKFSG